MRGFTVLCLCLVSLAFNSSARAQDFIDSKWRVAPSEVSIPEREPNFRPILSTEFRKTGPVDALVEEELWSGAEFRITKRFSVEGEYLGLPPGLAFLRDQLARKPATAANTMPGSSLPAKGLGGTRIKFKFKF